MVKIMTLMDNRCSEHKSLTEEHGLSFYVESEETKLLFDFGSGDSTWKNAVKLGVPLDKVTHFVFSHSHYDHAAGFIPFAERGYGGTAVYGSGFFQEKYVVGEHKYTYVGGGFSEEYLKQHSIHQVLCDYINQIAPDIWVVGGFERTHEFEKIPARFVKRGVRGLVPDLFEDEICLVVNTVDGLVVVAGCSHPGILNVLKTVSGRLKRPVYAVIGGTHLVETDEACVCRTILEMKSMGVGLLGINHCSGPAAEQIIHKDAQIASCYLGVGDCLML